MKDARRLKRSRARMDLGLIKVGPHPSCSIRPSQIPAEWVPSRVRRAALPVPLPYQGRAAAGLLLARATGQVIRFAFHQTQPWLARRLEMMRPSPRYQ